MKILVLNLYCFDKEISEWVADIVEEDFAPANTAKRRHRKFGPVARARKNAENGYSFGNE